MAKYQGHKNWNYWSVSLWVNNDEYLYRAALNCVRRYPKARDSAVRHFIGWLKDQGIEKTPDGAPYSIGAVRAAMVGMQ